MNKGQALDKNGDQIDYKAGARYECIYKNLLREIRQYYSSKFDCYVQKKFSSQNKYQKHKYGLFPHLILEFTWTLVNHQLMGIIQTKSQSEKN